MKYEIYEGRTEMNRKKTYLVFNPNKTSFMEAGNTAKVFFKCSADHVIVRPGWVVRGQLYLGAPTKPAKNARVVVVAYWA